MPRIRPETVLLKARMRALATVRVLPASYEKRFIRDVCAWPMPTTMMSDRQKALVEKLAWKFRRQLPAELVPAANPAPLPQRTR